MVWVDSGVILVRIGSLEGENQDGKILQPKVTDLDGTIWPLDFAYCKTFAEIVCRSWFFACGVNLRQEKRLHPRFSSEPKNFHRCSLFWLLPQHTKPKIPTVGSKLKRWEGYQSTQTFKGHNFSATRGGQRRRFAWAIGVQSSEVKISTDHLCGAASMELIGS